MLKNTHQALEKFDNQHDFERMSADILNGLGFKDVVPIAPKGGRDGGRDITFRTYDGQRGLACISLRTDVMTKIMEDLSQRSEGDFAEYTFFTNQYLTSTDKLKITKYCLEELKAEFTPRDIEHLRSLLDTSLKSIRKDYLNIEDEDIPSYKVNLIEFEKFWIGKKVEEASSQLDEYIAEKAKEERIAPQLGMLRSIAFTTENSVNEMIGYQSEYLKDLENYGHQKLDKLYKFNIRLVSTVADDHLEVVVIPETDSVELMFDALSDLPEEPKRYKNHSYIDRADFGNISIKDDTEFYALKKNDGSIKSNLEKLNPSHPKKLFDEDAFIFVKDESISEVILDISIFSTKLSQPNLIKLSIKLDDARDVTLK